MNKQNKVINTDHRTVVARGEGGCQERKGGRRHGDGRRLGFRDEHMIEHTDVLL